MDEIESVLYQYRKLCKAADEIHGLKYNVRKYREAILQNWEGVETEALINNVDELDRRLRKISAELIELGHDYLEVGKIKSE